EGNDSLSRTGDIKGELVIVFGKQDPHVSKEGRKLIYQKLEQVNANFTWQEVNA
ncbi:MAG TPA: dienelactone hydrolase, partial [Shewanella frigidimarina]|nr:dienelactone hydrolase [Shewanella frigidimarina]